MLADAIEQIEWMTAALSEQAARIEFLERRLAETTSDGLRYKLAGGRHGYVELVCTDEGCGGAVVASWPGGTRCLPVDAARARHDRENHRDAARPRIPARAFIESLAVLGDLAAAGAVDA
jgi:hypothetical protein